MEEERRPRDGSFPILERKIRRGVKLIINPNNMISPAAIVSREHGYVEMEPRAGWDTQAWVKSAVQITHNLQAIAPGDRYLGDLPNYRPPRVPNRAVQPPRPKIVDGQVVDSGVPELPPPPDPLELIRRGSVDSWPLGVSSDGEFAEFRPRMHVHAAVVGATGTGKTASLGYMWAAHAVMQDRYHLIVLDPEGGVDWGRWKRCAEVVEVDYTTFPGYVEQLAVLMDDIHRPSVAVVIEEFGDLMGRLRVDDRALYNRTVGLLETIMRRGRKARMHLLLLDQAPTHWPGQVVANARWVAAFRLGPHRGNALQIYGAERLPERGVFLWDSERYVAPHVAPVLDELLSQLPRSELRMLDRSVFVRSDRTDRSSVDTPSLPNTERPNGWSPTEIQEAVWSYLARNPEATQAELRREFGLSRAYVHELWHRWRDERFDGREDGG